MAGPSLVMQPLGVNLLQQLQHMSFPECTHVALNYMIHSDISLNPQFASQIACDFILFSNISTKTLNNIEELQLLEILLDFFASLQKSIRLKIFDVIFGGKPDDVKVSVFNKLTSLAISLECTPVLDCNAAWIKHHGYQSRPAADVAQHLITDFCTLYPGICDSMVALSSRSPELTCHLMVVCGNIFDCHDEASHPPEKLIQYITSWLLDPVLPPMMRNLVQVNPESCPITGFINWVITLTVANSSQSGQIDDGSSRYLHSRFHLALLHTILACSGCGSLITIKDLRRLAKKLNELSRKCVQSESFVLVVEQFGQILQVILATENLRYKPSDLRNIIKDLPQNQLLDIILKNLNTS